MGRARTGKSERVLQRIAALGDSSQQILLVPEHASHVAEMDLCRVCGDTASRHAEALTFKLLASRVLSICGGSADVTLDSGGKLLTLQRTLTELAPVLKVYKRPSQRAAFLESLLAVMEELQAYAVSPEQLSESVAQIEGECGDKLRDLSLIYGIYLSKLHAPGHDARDVLEKLEENLEASGYIDNKDIFLDGFSYFTGRELRILRILLRRAKSVTVTLLGDTQDRELFSESLRVRERLYALARDAGVACEEKILPQGEVRGALDHIERCFFGAADEFTQPTDTVALYEAGSAYSECEWVASQVLQLVRKQGYRYREITVTARDLDSYAGAIENVFARYGIPLYYAHRSDILKSPVLTLLLGALDAASGGFEYEDVFRCLKTGLAGLSMAECDILENYALKWEIRGAMWTRETPWSAHPDGYGEDWTDEARARLKTVNALRERVQGPFARLKKGVGGSGEAEQKVRALYGYLEEIKLPEVLQTQTEQLFAAGEAQRAEETAQLWSILCGVLDQFVEILGDAILDAEEFASLMRLVLTQYSVGTIPVTLDAVNLCEMTRNDRHTVRALFLLGANDGVLPAAENRGGVLPLKKGSRIALVGPFADSRWDLIGSWVHFAEAGRTSTFLDGLRARFGADRVTYARGCDPHKALEGGISEAVAAAAKSDVVLVALGLKAGESGEAASLASLALPDAQRDLLESLKQTGKPIVVLLVTGRPMELAREAELADALLLTWYPGTMAGEALADVVSGDYNPSGRLPMTFPRTVGQIPIHYDMKSTGRPADESGKPNKYTSRYLDVPNSPQYCFGYGLSYTTFGYSDLRVLTPETAVGGEVRVSVRVTNTGGRDGEEVVQLYVRDLLSGVTRPVRELKGFRKVMLRAGESREVTFTLTPDDLSFWRLDKKWGQEPGDYHVWVGHDSDCTLGGSFRITE